MSAPPHRTGTIDSADVSLFYRHFGAPGARPVLIVHGANYYDSRDWVDVAAALSRDREVVAWDMRGFGESTWSANKDYSHDAIIGDMTRILAHF
jgi:esterase